MTVSVSLLDPFSSLDCFSSSQNMIAVTESSFPYLVLISSYPIEIKHSPQVHNTKISIKSENAP
jgi:hypothetical protein